MNSFSAYLRQFGTALRFLLLATAVLGVIYPLAVWGVGQLAAPSQANGSLVQVAGQPAASSLIAQSPEDGLGQKWFHPRPSAVSWNPLSSSASNLGPNDPKLVEAISQLRQQVAQTESVDATQVPIDAVTASGSGLDPQISLAYAQLQVPRIAQATGVSQTELQGLIKSRTTSGLESLLGQESVNVTLLNLDLAAKGVR
ncbi:K(+)-transporting ATPase subunit C [Psychromicrobium lacuslunae]|uniref:Potassium-transporting ATPase KdpC subunit n=1 Tax=Psychromicrobium lacuslunae TaxID=1618207 RepID=A0A0D4C0C3_9MICC|nr:K(+)-transporting ATPase subunit C [Psychromicrobium lacuslunae]AJT41816.1 potassium transporter KtrA [Psychromicrobium lacuslunae]